jgi:hypothetical protein
MPSCVCVCTGMYVHTYVYICIFFLRLPVLQWHILYKILKANFV